VNNMPARGVCGRHIAAKASQAYHNPLRAVLPLNAAHYQMSVTADRAAPKLS
jgi:hypothetical protein